VIPADRAHLRVTAVSHPGMSGKNNEDRYGVSAYYTDADRETPVVLAVVADGIGGHRAGEVAAEIAVEAISAWVAESDASQPVDTLRQAIIHAGQVISEMAESDPTLNGMGSTCACAWIIGDHLYIATVGDSRIYLIRDNAIQRLTTDHTWVQEAIDHGLLGRDEARNHPNAHVIRRYLGSRQDTVPDTRLRLLSNESDSLAEANQGVRLLPGDLLVLCSDGLTDLVEDDEILGVLETRNNQGALEDLVKMSNRRGGHDNVTIITLAVPDIERPTTPVTERQARKRMRSILIAAAALGLAIITLLGGMIWYFAGSSQEPTPTPSATRQVQATLFPDQATQPGLFPTEGGTPGALPTTEPGSPEPVATTSLTSPPTPILATLTPWPTNTVAP